MKWKKMGRIYCPSGKYGWDKHSAMTPTPIMIDENTIRIYAGFRDEHGISRIGFVEVDAENPSKIKKISEKPVLDIGRPGAFDDNGVILGDIVEHNGKLYMYYVGFQLVQKAKFLAFTGLAISDDGGITFERYSDAPILDRCNNEIYIRAIHSVMIEGNIWRVWYAAGNDWVWINGTPYPKYNIRYLESLDGINFNQRSILCIDTEGREYRIGRPRVYKWKNKYVMFYTRGTLDGDYIAGYAESKDGINWTRKDSELGITLSKKGWDSRSLCYPSILKYKDRVYMFYNGNDMGKTGFGYAILEEE